MKDEARHVAFGLLALQDAYKDITDAERREREEFVIEAARLLRDRIVAEEVYDQPRPRRSTSASTSWTRSDIMNVYRMSLFARVVPTVKRIGLWSDKIQQAFIDLGVMAYANAEPDEMFANDERIAEELEAAIAALRSGERRARHPGRRHRRHHRHRRELGRRPEGPPVAGGTDDNAGMGHSHGDKESARVHARARILLFVLVVPAADRHRARPRRPVAGRRQPAHPRLHGRAGQAGRRHGRQGRTAAPAGGGAGPTRRSSARRPASS